MLRKLSLVAVAVAALGATLAPNAASAHFHGGGFGGHGGGGWHGGGGGWHGGGWHGGFHRAGFGPRFYGGGPAYSYGYGGCYVRRLVPTPWGPRVRLINRC